MARVLYVNPAGNVSGAENSLLALIGTLDKKKYQPIMACPSQGGFSERCQALGLPVHPISFYNPAFSSPYSMLVLRPLQTRKLVSRIEEIARAEKVDLIHANSYLVGPASGTVARRLGIPIIWHIRDMRYGLKQIVIRYLAARLADRVLVVSQAVKDSFGGCLDKKVLVVHNGSLPVVLSEEDRVRCRAELGVGQDEFLVGNSGMLVPRKGQDIFVQIAHRVLSKIPQAKFVVVGSAQPQSLGFEQHVKALAESLGIQEKVIFTGFRKDALSITASMDIYLHTARWPDPLPRSVLEAMAAGVPVVAPSVGGIPEMIDDGESGLLYPMDDVEKAAEQAICLLESPQTSKSIGQAGAERIKSDFSIESHTRRVQEIYAELLS